VMHVASSSSKLLRGCLKKALRTVTKRKAVKRKRGAQKTSRRIARRG
jgi:hypothetical protein